MKSRPSIIFCEINYTNYSGVCFNLKIRWNLTIQSAIYCVIMLCESGTNKTFNSFHKCAYSVRGYSEPWSNNWAFWKKEKKINILNIFVGSRWAVLKNKGEKNNKCLVTKTAIISQHVVPLLLPDPYILCLCLVCTRPSTMSCKVIFSGKWI